MVSGYFYHLWTTEEWANRPDQSLGGRTYKEELNRLDLEDGMHLEIARVCRTVLREMLRWDYDQPEFLELKYESLIELEIESFEMVFRHYQLSGSSIRKGLEAVRKASFSTVTGKPLGQGTSTSHLRSGLAGQWREHFSAEHLRHWEALAGDAAQRLGYP